MSVPGGASNNGEESPAEHSGRIETPQSRQVIRPHQLPVVVYTLDGTFYDCAMDAADYTTAFLTAASARDSLATRALVGRLRREAAAVIADVAGFLHRADPDWFRGHMVDVTLLLGRPE